MNTDDDQAWLDALAGRESATSPTTREAQVLRAALRAHQAPENLAGPRDAGREEALIARAVREGVIDRTETRRRMNWRLPLAASILIFFAAGAVLQWQSASNMPIVRGDENGIVHLRSADPAALKRDILEALRDAGATATGYESLGMHGIDADLSVPVSSAVKRVLADHGIPEPADGVLRIEIRSDE
jgi:hypothetical protein